jgi:hypothetical protein
MSVHSCFSSCTLAAEVNQKLLSFMSNADGLSPGLSHGLKGLQPKALVALRGPRAPEKLFFIKLLQSVLQVIYFFV